MTNIYQPDFEPIIKVAPENGAGDLLETNQNFSVKKYLTSKYISIVIIVIGLILVIGAFVPAMAANINSKISQRLKSTADLPSIEDVQIEKRAYMPAFDASLPNENRLEIPSIKVTTTINEAELDNYEDALRIGVWRASDSSTPQYRDKPMILAAHRYGYFKWSNLYRRENSFYNLPKLKEGDTVEVIWNQRRYYYAVYRIDEGEKILDYSADLILYTCRDLTSDERLFIYAKLLEI